MTSTLYCLCHTTLEFERSTGDTAGKYLALLVEELLEEFSVLVIDILDTGFFEAAIFFLFDLDGGRIQVSDL